MPGANAYVLDAHNRPVPVQVAGELHLAGRNLARGYLNQRELTESRFPPDPFSPDGRMFSTGERARILPDGSIELLGRAENHVDLGGFLVEPARIEAALSRWPGVQDVAVVERQETDDRPRLVAYVVCRGRHAPPTLAEFRTLLWSRIPGYAWPAALAFVASIPRLAGGRVNLAALPPPEEPDPSIDAVAPELKILAAKWAEAVGIERVRANEFYWQDLSFLEVPDAARRAGLVLRREHVARNRTLEMLATAVAAEALAAPPSAG